MKRTTSCTRILTTAALALLLTGCASMRSDMTGRYRGEKSSPTGTGKVSVAFVFTHVHQMKGFDVIPKIDGNYQVINGFDDLFADALPEISNVGRYVTFTELSSDVNNPGRRAHRDSLVAASDYTVKLRFSRETSFAKRILGGIGSTLSLTFAPVPYTRKFGVTASVYDRSGRLVKEYERSAHVTTWIQTFLFVVYPFHPEGRKNEEVYAEFLHDIFREIEADRVLAPSRGGR